MRSPVEKMVMSSWIGEEEQPSRAGNDISSCGLPKAVVEHALAASCAVYEKSIHAATTAARNLLLEDCSCTFINLPPDCRFLILKSSRGVFVAFPGTHSISDVLCNLSLQPQPWASAGLLHQGFSERASRVPLGTILEAVQPPPGKSVTPPRLTLCGHSLGGAVAQIVLLRLLAFHTPGLEDSSAAAISFGGPFFCDKVAADVINAQHIRRLITFVYRDDVVPRVFHSPGNATGTFMDSLFGVVGAPLGATFHPKAEGLTQGTRTSAKPEEEPLQAFEPVGTYTFLRSSHVLTAPAGSPEFRRAMGGVPGGSGLSDHLLASYRNAVFHTGKMADDNTEPLEGFHSGRVLVDDTQLLEVASATLTAALALALAMEGAAADLQGRSLPPLDRAGRALPPLDMAGMIFPPLDMAGMGLPEALKEESPSTKTGACSCFPSRKRNKVHSF